MSFELRDLRMQLLILVAVLLLVDVAAIAVLVSPIGRGGEARHQRYRELQLEKTANTQAAAATQGMERKIATAAEQENTFNRDRFIGRYSEMSETLSQIAGKAGVRVSDVKYDAHQKDPRGQRTAPAGYNGLEIVMQVHGSYTQNMRFINALERQKTLLLINDVRFGGMKGDELTVSVHLTTYLRSAA